MPYPDGFSFARYDAAQGVGDMDADLIFLGEQFDKHAWALIAALREIETRDSAINDMAHDLAEVLEKGCAAIKLRGDL